jgi:hypothetical protein
MVTINGKTYHGNSVSIINGVVTIDGVRQTGEPLSGVVKVEITGNLTSLRTDANVIMAGNVLGDVDAGGSVQCDAVGKSVDAGGSVQCNDVEGDVDAGGSVTCGVVGGDVDAGGSVIHS